MGKPKYTFKIGDRVRVIDSGHLGVKVGTVSTITGYRNTEYGRMWTRYEINVPYRLSFYEWQLEAVNEKK